MGLRLLSECYVELSVLLMGNHIEVAKGIATDGYFDLGGYTIVK